MSSADTSTSPTFRAGQPVDVEIWSTRTNGDRIALRTAFAGIVVRKMPTTRGHAGRGFQVRSSVTGEVWIVRPEDMRDAS